MFEVRAGCAALAVGAVCTAGCSGNGADPETAAVGGFQLVEIGVPEGELRWPINRPIELRFNLPVDFTSVSPNTISIRQSNGVAATGSFDAWVDPVTGAVDPTAVLFRPACPREPQPYADAGLLPGGVEYQIRVHGHESGLTVLSRDGRALVTGQTRTFRTPESLEAAKLFYDPVPGAPRVVVRGEDGTPLAATAASRIELGPEHEEVYFERDADDDVTPGRVLPLNLYSRPDSRWSVVLVFDQPIDTSADSVSEDTVRLEFRDGEGVWRPLAARVEVEANCTETGAQVRLSPAGPLPAAADVRVLVTNALRDLRGETASHASHPVALRTAESVGGAHDDAFVEEFVVGGGGVDSFEDVATVFAEGRAAWGDGECRATLHFDGTGGPGGDFDVVVESGEKLTFDTVVQLLQNANQTRQAQFFDGVLDVRSLVVERDAELLVRGPNPFVLRATGDVVIEGTIDVSGLDAADVAGLMLANVPHEGASTACGSGAGGISSPVSTASSPRGGAGSGAFGTKGLGGGGGESGHSGSLEEHLRRPGGGGGGVFGADVLATVPTDRGSSGLAAQPGFAGMDSSPFGELSPPNIGAYGAESGSLRPEGGAVGPSPFLDSDPTNDFWGVRNDEDGGVTLGELPHVWAGSGGGAGGDAIPTALFPNPDYLSPTHADERGGSGGSGGGSCHVLALGDIRFGPEGRIVCNGGAGGRGESTSGFDNLGGGGGGGSGGHVVLETNGFLDLTAVGAEHVVVSARGGPGGDGIPSSDGSGYQQVLGYPLNRGGDGGPGLVQVHVPGATLAEQGARVLLPGGSADLDAHTVPSALLLVPSFGSRSRAQSRWIALGGASPASGSGGDPVRFLFGGTDPADGSVLDADGDGTVDALPAVAHGELIAVAPEIGSVSVSTSGWQDGEAARLVGNPALLRGFALEAGGTSFEVLGASEEGPGAIALQLDGAASALSPGAPFALVPRYFRVVTGGQVDHLPPSATLRIEFQATGPDGSGAPDEDHVLVGWTGDVEELNRSDLPAPIAFFRYRVLFDADALGAGLAGGLPLPALDFLSLPFRFGDL